jgi:hypothetical protein
MPENLAGAPYLAPRQKVVLPSVDTSDVQGQTLQTREPQTMDDFILRQSAIDARKPKGVSAEGPMLSEVADQLTGRYDTIVYGANNEDAYAQQQSGLAQAVNGTLKGLNIAGTTIAGGFGMVGGLVGSLFTQKLSTIWDNPVMNNLDKWDNYVDQQLLPNYESDTEKEAAWYDTDNWATTNFLFNKLVKNSGFAVGAMVSGNMVNGLLKGAGASIGAALDARATAAAANQTFKIFSPLLKNTARAFSAAKNAEAAALLEAGVSNIGDVDALAAEFANIASTTNKLANIGDKTRRAVIAGYSSLGEANFEAGQTAKEYRETLIQQYKDSHFGIAPSGDELKAIDESASNVGATSLIGNVALLGVTEYAQLNKLLGSSYSAEKQAANSMMGKVAETVIDQNGKHVAKVATTKFGKIAEGALKVGKFVFDPKEALQENLQYALQIGTQNYFNKAYQGKEAQNLIDSALYGLTGVDKYGKAVGSFNSKEGLEGTLLGGITGGMMQAIGNWNEAAKKSANTTTHLQELNAAPTFRAAFVDRMGSVNRGVKLQEEEQDAIIAGDILEAQDRKADQMHNYLSTRIKYGRFDMVMQDIEDLRRISSTKEGISQLKEEGTANINDDVQSFQNRLNTFEKVAYDTNEIYKALDLRYSGMVNKEGELLYTPETIDKLAYASSKISNYDRRIPEVNAGLDSAGVYTGDMFEKIMEGLVPTAEAKKQAYTFIDKLDVAPEQKTTLKLALDDVVEMALRRKLYMNEYEDIRNNPDKWQAKDMKASAEEVVEEEEILPPPAAAQPATAAPVTATEPTAEEPVVEAPVVVAPTATYVKKNGQVEDLEVGREYESGNTSNPLNKFKVVKINDDGTVDIELPDGSIATYDPALFVGYDKVRTGKDSIINNAEIKEIQDELEDKTDLNTGVESDEYLDETDKEEGLPPADILFLRTTTSGIRRYGIEGLPINITRYNEFTNNVDSFDNRKNIRFVYVTYNQQAELGLSGLSELSYMKEDGFVANKDWADSITEPEDGLVMAVFVEADGGKLFLVDKDGKRIKNQDGSDAVLGNANNNFDIKQTIFSTTPKTTIKGRSSDDPAVIEHYRKQWKDKRKALFAQQYQPGQPIESYEFGLSKGFAVSVKGKIQHNPISKIFNKLKQSVISGTQGLIEISTLGTITHKDGINYKFDKGRPVLNYGDKLQYLQNDKFNENQAIAITEVLKKLHNILVNPSLTKDQKIKESNKLTTYLKSVLFWSSKKVTHNSFYINYSTGNINIAGNEFDFSDIEGNKKDIIDALKNIYSNTNNELITKFFNEPFYEQYWDGKQLNERKWKNYQTYLLSDVMPDNKTARKTTPPLTVNITVPTEEVPYAYEQRYAFSTNFKFAAPQELAPQDTTVAVSPIPQSTGFDLTNTKPNDFVWKDIPFKFYTDGTNVTIDYSNDETIDKLFDFINTNPLTKDIETSEATATIKTIIESLIKKAVTDQVVAQVPAPVVEDVAPQASQVGELVDLDEVLDNYGVSDIFKFISPILKGSDIRVSFDAAHMGGKLPKVASIDRIGDKIILTINRSTFDRKPKADQRYVLAHEFVHGLIKVRFAEKGAGKETEVYKGLDDIYRDVVDYYHRAVSGVDETAWAIVNKNFSKPKITELRRKLDYIGESIEEMATLGLTDPDMIKFLKLMPGTAPEYTKKNLFTQLVDLISKFIGISNSKFNDLLTFMSNQLEEATSDSNTLDLSGSAQIYLNQPQARQPRKKRDEFPVFDELSAQEKYYAVQDFTARFYLTLFNNNMSLYNIDTTVANPIFRGIIESYKADGSQLTDDQYMEIIDATKRNLSSLYLSFNADEIVSINDESASDRLYAPEAFSVDLKKSTPYAVKILNSSLVRTDGKPSENPSILPKPKLNGKHGRLENTIELIPESEVYGVLVNKLVNIKSADDFINKLYELALANPDYVQLFVRLGGSMITGKVDFELFQNSDFRLFVSAMQTYTKSKPEMFIQYLKEDSTFRGAADLTTGANQVEKRWINNIILSSKIDSSIIKYDSGGKQYVVENADYDISTPEKMIDFLNKLGITFTPSIYNKLNEDQVKKFGRAVAKIKADITSGKAKGIVTLKKGKFKTLGNGISRLAEMFTAVEMPNQSNSIYNAEGKRINTLTESNAPSLFEYQFNSIMNLSEIAEKMPNLLDIFSTSSDVLKRGGLFFNEDGDRILDEFGNVRELRVQVISGEIDTDESEGEGISRMNQADRYITEINQNVNGSYYILVPADASIQWMLNLGNRVSYNQFASGRGIDEAIEIMKKHLDADIDLALDAKNREKLKNVKGKGRELRFFKDILPQDLLDAIDSLVKQRIDKKLSEKKFRDALDTLKVDNADKINNAIIDYFNNKTDNVINTLEDLKLVTVSSSDKNDVPYYTFKKLDANFQEEVKRVSGVNTNNMTEEDLRILAEFLTVNYELNNIELHKLIFGDPYQFAVKKKNDKTILEETKRVKMFISPRKFSIDFPELNNWMNESNTIDTGTEYIDLDENDYGYHENKSFINVSVIKEVEVVSSLYPGVDTKEADAFSIMSSGFYKEVKGKNGQWSDEANAFHNWQMAYTRKKLSTKIIDGEPVYKGYDNKPALKKYDEELTSKDRPVFVIDITKPIVSGNKYGKVTIDLAGHKMSQMPLYYEAIEGTALEDLFIKMFKENRDYVVMESGSKVGTEEMHKLYTDGKVNTEPFNNLIQVPFEAYGIQVETGYKDKRGQTLGSQPTKIMTIDLFSGGEPIGDTPARKEFIKNAVERHDNALKRLYNESADSLLRSFDITFEDGKAVINNKTKLADLLREELINDDSSNNLIASLAINPETNDFVTPLEASPNYMQITRLLYSIIHKRIVSPKMNGMSAVQAPVTLWENPEKGRRIALKTDEGYEEIDRARFDSLSDEEKKKVVLTDDTLKFYTKEEPWCEIYTTLPSQARKFFSDKTKFPNEKAILDYLNLRSPEALMGIGFRIPNQALNSNERFKIVGLLPDFMGATVIVPSLITTKAGSDFDIDKLNMYIKALFKNEDGQIVTVPFINNEKDTKEYLTKVFNNTILKDIKKAIKYDNFRSKLIDIFSKIEAASEERTPQDILDEDDYEFYTNHFELLSNIEDQAFEEDLDASEYVSNQKERLLNKADELRRQLMDIDNIRENYVNRNYRLASENEYYSSIDTLLALPENFERLTTPNSTDNLMEIAEEMDTLTGYDESKIKNRILDRTYMSFARHAFLISKQWIGLSATATTGQSLTQKAGSFVDHVFKMSLPHNKTADGKVDLSQRFFAGTKKFISDILSEFTSAFADAGTDPFIFKLIYSNQIVSSFMFLTRAGSMPRASTMFLNQPIVKDFVTTADADNKYILPEITNSESTLVKSILDKYSASEAAVERTTDINIANLDKNIGVRLTDDQKAEQLLILQEFFNIAKAANGLYIVTEATNYDTARFSNADDFRRKLVKTLSQYKFKDDSFRISSAKDILDKTHLRTLVNALTKANLGMGAILRFNTPAYRSVINRVIDAYANNDFISPTKFSKIANKLSASLLDYIIQTNKVYNVGELVDGEDSVINKFQKAVVAHPDIQILQDLEIIPGKTKVSPATIALKVPAETAADKNRYTEGFRELRDIAETNDLYKDLVKLAIVQGTYKTKVSFKELIPEEDLSVELVQSINAPGVEDRLKDFYENARFQRTNFNDPDIAPRINPPIEQVLQGSTPTPWGDMIDLYSFTTAISFGKRGEESVRDLIGLYPKSKGAAYDLVVVPRAINAKGGDTIDYETGYSVQASDFAIEMQKDESAYSKVYGYQKVKYSDGTPVMITMYDDGPALNVYKLVNLYSDGRFLTEYYNTLQKSELENGTVKLNTEYSNDAIIRWLGRQNKLTGLVQPTAAAPSEFDKLPSKSATPTMTYAGIGSRETPKEVLDKMTEVSKYLESQGYTLNTGVTFQGKEEGADAAFSRGTTKKNLFSPENQGGRTKEKSIAKEIHPNPSALKEGGLKLMARNTNQIFGDDLNTPVDFVLFYAKETKGIRPEGGTGQAVEMARRKGIPAINMANADWRDQLKQVLSPQAQPTQSAAVAETKPANIEVINKLEMAKNKLEAFEVSTDGILYNYFRGGARLKASSFDELVDRNLRSASTNGAYISKDGMPYDNLATSAFEASGMPMDNEYAVEALREFLTNYPDNWKTPYNNIINEIDSLEEQLGGREVTVRVGKKQITIKPEGEMFEDGKPVTDTVLQNQASIAKEIRNQTLRTSISGGFNFFILSDNKILLSGKNNVGKEYIADPEMMQRILDKAVIYKKTC